MAKGRKLMVVDTNVAVVANRRDGGSYACASACANHLLLLRGRGTLIIDDREAILNEYKKYLNYKGQPGAGDAFFRWLFNNRGRSDLCREVSVSPIEHEWRLFEEFPDMAGLSNFDKADQKFVAVASSAGHSTTILQASDHKWLDWNELLSEAGVKVLFICKDEVEETRRNKPK